MKEDIIIEKNYFPFKKSLQLINKGKKNEIYILRMINEEKKDIEIPREWTESIIFYEQEDSKKYFGISKYPIIEVNEEEFIKDKIKFLKLLKPLLEISSKLL